MTSSLERRIERLESNTHVGADVEKARAIFNAYVRVTDHPAQASDEDRALLAHEDWQHAFSILIDAAGGLGAVVLASYEIEAAEKAKQIEGQVVKQVPAK